MCQIILTTINSGCKNTDIFDMNQYRETGSMEMQNTLPEEILRHFMEPDKKPTKPNEKPALFPILPGASPSCELTIAEVPAKAQADLQRLLRLQRKRDNEAIARQNETEQQRFERLERMKKNIAAKRAAETQEQKIIRLQQKRDMDALIRQNETEEERNDRLGRVKNYIASKRSMETEEQRMLRLQRKRDAVAAARLLETKEQRAARLDKAKKAVALKRAKESEMQRLLRLQQKRDADATTRLNETEEERYLRLERMKIAVAANRAKESEECRLKRLERNKHAVAAKRATETAEQRALRLERMKQNVAAKRAKKSIQQRENKSIELPVTAAAISYLAEVIIKEEPIENEPISVVPVTKKSKIDVKPVEVFVPPIIENTIKFTDALLQSDEKISAYTGLTIQQFNNILYYVKNVLPEFDNMHSVDIEKKIMFVFTKLKLNMSFKCLAILFEISSPIECFHDSVLIISRALKSIIFWPHSYQTINVMPHCFENYKNVRLVLATVEVLIEKSRCLKCQVRSYSCEKKCSTLKFLIGFTSSGLISYLSSGYGGSLADNLIIMKEKLLDKFDPYDALMVFKEYSIDNECLEKNVMLVKPPSCFNNKMVNIHFALCQSYIEGILQTTRNFKIFDNTLEYCLVEKIDDIMTIICAVVNLIPAADFDRNILKVKEENEECKEHSDESRYILGV